MPLFGFGDIQFNKGETARKGPLADLVDNKFKTTLLKYPLDVGSADKGHYMVFYIRQQKNTAFETTTVTENEMASAANRAQSTNSQTLTQLNSINQNSLNTQIGGNLLSKVNNSLSEINNSTGGTLSGITSAIGKAVGGISSSVQNLFGQKTNIIGGNSVATQAVIDTSIKNIVSNSIFPKTTQLTSDSIALYMPDTLSYQYSQSYDTPSLGGEATGQAVAAGGALLEKIKEGDLSGAAGGLAKAAAGGVVKNLVDKFGGSTGQLAFTAITGAVSNPLLEMIYKSPNFRTFQFDFTFYPRDEREALEVQQIIEKFRFHQAPEIASAANFLIPPSEFDIKFYYGGAENPNIPPIATCVLENIDVNYTPNGFSAYEVPGENLPSLGRTGMPVAIQMTMQFKETTYLTKSNFKSNSAENRKEVKGLGQTFDNPAA